MGGRRAALDGWLPGPAVLVAFAVLVFAVAWVAQTAWNVKANWGEMNTSEMNAAIHSHDCRPAPGWMLWPWDRDWDYRCGPDTAGDYTDYRVNDKRVIDQTAAGKP